MTPKARSSVSAAGPSFRCAVAATRRTSRFAMAATRPMPSPQLVKRGIYLPKFRDWLLAVSDWLLAVWSESWFGDGSISFRALHSGFLPRVALSRCSRAGLPAQVGYPTRLTILGRWKESAGIAGSSHGLDLRQCWRELKRQPVASGQLSKEFGLGKSSSDPVNGLRQLHS